MKLRPTDPVDRAAAAAKTTSVEQTKLAAAIDYLDPQPSSGLRFPRFDKVLTGPLRLVTMAGRMMRKNVAVTAAIAGAALGFGGVGVDYYQSTRVPTEPAASVTILVGEIEARIGDDTYTSMADAHWALNRLAQADDVLSVESAVRQLGPSLLQIVRGAPPGWTLHPEFRDVALYMVESTDDRTLPRDDPTVRALVDALYPEVASAADDVGAHFDIPGATTANDARWLLDRLAVFGVDVREVLYRVDVGALLPAITTLGAEDVRHHEAFLRELLDAAPVDHPDVAKLVLMLEPGTEPVLNALQAAPTAQALEILGRARRASDVYMPFVIESLGAERFADIISALPTDRIAAHKATLRMMLDTAPDKFTASTDPDFIQRLAVLKPDVDAIVTAEVLPLFSGDRITSADAITVMQRLEARASTSLAFDHHKTVETLGSDRLLSLLNALPTDAFHRPNVRSLIAAASGSVVERGEPAVEDAVRRYFPYETAMSADILALGDDSDAVIDRLGQPVASDFAWAEVIEQLGPEAIDAIVREFPLERAAASKAFLGPLLNAASRDVVSPNDSRVVELRLRIDDINWGAITKKTRGWIDLADRSMLFVDGPEVDDLKQGIGTCYLTSVIASIAHTHPEYLEEIVVDRRTVDGKTRAKIDASLPEELRGQWTCAVRLFENTQGFIEPRWIPVEPRLPVDWAPSEGLPKDALARRHYWKEHVFSRDRGPNNEVEIYAGLIEQAAAEFERGSIPKRWRSIDDWRAGNTIEERYDKLVGGHPQHSMEWLLGTSGTTIQMNHDAESAWQTLIAAVDGGQAMVARLEGHVRVVTGYEEVDGRRSVKMYDTAPGAEMSMSWEEFRRVHEYTLHANVPNDSTVRAHNEKTASLYVLLAALMTAIGLLTRAGVSRSKRAAALKTVRAAHRRGLLSPAEFSRIRSLVAPTRT